MKKIKSFFKDAFSLDEARVSSLIIVMFTMMIFFMVMYSMHGDVSMNLSNIFLFVLGCVAGVNSVNSIKDIFVKNTETTTSSSTEETTETEEDK